MSTKAIETLISRWSDQKLAEVLAFNEDGKMRWNNTCACIIGVSGSDALHERCDGNWDKEQHHYLKLKISDPIYYAAEREYGALGGDGAAMVALSTEAHLARRAAFDAILRAEIARRDALAAARPEPACAPALATAEVCP